MTPEACRRGYRLAFELQKSLISTLRLHIHRQMALDKKCYVNYNPFFGYPMRCFDKAIEPTCLQSRHRHFIQPCRISVGASACCPSDLHAHAFRQPVPAPT